jgi:hypothetical protein
VQAIGIGGDRDDRNIEALGVGQHVSKLHGLTGPREEDEHVVRCDHAEIAVAGFRRMHEIGGGASRCHGRRNLAANMPALANAGNDHTTVAASDKFDGVNETA